MPGSMRQRGENSWNLRVYAGRDAVTGRKISVERTVRGNKREASKTLAAMVAEVDRRPAASTGKGTVAQLCREWLDQAAPSFSPKTVQTTRMYIEDPIIPAGHEDPAEAKVAHGVDQPGDDEPEEGRHGPAATAG